MALEITVCHTSRVLHTEVNQPYEHDLRTSHFVQDSESQGWQVVHLHFHFADIPMPCNSTCKSCALFSLEHNFPHLTSGEHHSINEFATSLSTFVSRSRQNHQLISLMYTCHVAVKHLHFLFKFMRLVQIICLIMRTKSFYIQVPSLSVTGRGPQCSHFY